MPYGVFVLEWLWLFALFPLFCSSSSLSCLRGSDALKERVCMCMLSQCLCVSPLHLGLVRSQLNEVTLTITRDVYVYVCL